MECLSPPCVSLIPFRSSPLCPQFFPRRSENRAFLVAMAPGLCRADLTQEVALRDLPSFSLPHSWPEATGGREELDCTCQNRQGGLGPPPLFSAVLSIPLPRCAFTLTGCCRLLLARSRLRSTWQGLPQSRDFPRAHLCRALLGWVPGMWQQAGGTGRVV